jgi:small-conductance mechanosensitive channel/CRP-like cAMP-binding protein
VDALLSLRATDFVSEVVGIVLAFFLLVLSFVLLPKEGRQRVHQGAVLFLLSIVCGVTRQLFPHDASFRRPLFFGAVFFLLASIGRSLVLLVLDVVLGRRGERPTPRIFRDLTTGVVYVIVALFALRTIDVEPGSILTTSALLTAVMGFALQDTLGNLVSGLALQMQRPFDVGDWIEVDNGAQAGRVTEVTWRATSMMTLDHVEVILPNAGLAKSAIRNYSRPSKVSRRRVVIGVAYSAPPAEVHEALVSAAIGAPGVLTKPAPFARTKSFADSAIEYELLFFVDDFEHANNVDGGVRDRIYYALARRGLEIPFPTHTLLLPQTTSAEEAKKAELARRATLVDAVLLFAPLPEDARRVIAERAVLRTFGPGEIVIRKGDPSDDMYIIERGAVVVEVPRNAGDATPVALLKQGDWFGEMGLLAGEPRAATVRATALCHLLVIDHAAFHEVLASHPEVVERMGQLLAERQAGLEAASTQEEAPSPTSERSRKLISQIRIWFKLA